MSKNKELLLEVKDLQVYFPVYGGVFQRKVNEVKAVDGVSFKLYKGETMGIVGESGCGKTTVGRAIINVLRHVSPDVHIGGQILYYDKGNPVDLAHMDKKEMLPYRSKIQMIFQDPYSSLNVRHSIRQIIGEPMGLHMPNMSSKEIDEKVEWLLEKVGLQPEYSVRFPHEFSGGQRQRIGIARSLATNPDLIVCDEPVSALDVSVQAQVINLMEDLKKEFDMSYMFIAHDLSVVEHISDRIGVMYLGNMVEIGTDEQVYFEQKHPYSKALLSAVPRPDPKRSRAQRVVLEGDIPTPLSKPSGCGFRTRCPIAKPSCAEAVPELVEDGDGHFVACPFHEEMPRPVTP